MSDVTATPGPTTIVVDPSKPNATPPLTPEQLADLDRTNPVMSARYRAAHKLEPAATPGVDPDGRRRVEAMRPKPVEAPTTPPVIDQNDPRIVYAELKKNNPVVAARYAIEHRLFDK